MSAYRYAPEFPSPRSARAEPDVGGRTIYEDGYYFEHHRTWHEEDGPFKAKNILKLLDRSSLSPRSICDVGCGTGAVLDALTQRIASCRGVGFEVSPQAIEMASRRTRPGLTFRLSNAFDQPEVFDVALALDVFEHVEDYLSFLRNMRRISRWQVYHVPLDLSVQGLVRHTGIARARRELGHLHHFTRDTALATLEHTGHHVVDWFYTTLDRAQPMSVSQRLALYPRTLALRLAPDLLVRLLGGFSMAVLCN